MSRLDRFGSRRGGPRQSPFTWPQLCIPGSTAASGGAIADGAHDQSRSIRVSLSGGIHIPALAAAPLLRFWEPLDITKSSHEHPEGEAGLSGRDSSLVRTAVQRGSEGRIALFMRLLHEDGQPITSRDEATLCHVLDEWDHLGRLCVCREELPAIPRWLPWGIARSASDGDATQEVLQFVAVEFADGFRTLLQRAELRLLPVYRTSPGR